MTWRRRKVCVVQYRLLHYRVELFERLRVSFDAAGVDLLLVHGQPTEAESSRRDTGTLPWATAVRNRVVRLGGKDVLWQPMPAKVSGNDLVILMQESRLLSNYPWVFGLGPADTRVAYWGHGRNFQSTVPSGLRERWKRWTLGRVDWWFAYTELTREIVRSTGYPAERITVLNNAIDNERFKADLAAVSVQDLVARRRTIGATERSVVGLFCGSLWPEKRLDLLIDACERIVTICPDFRLVVLGDGPSRHILQRAAGRHWLHWAGAQRGGEKAAWFRTAQLCLNPGAVGLHILDSFVAGIPMITTIDAKHGPEIAYLRHEENGLICEGNAAAYADAVLHLTADPRRYERLRSSAVACASQYTLDEMVRRYTEGVVTCLARSRLFR